MHSLTSALDGGERSASHSDRLTPRESAPRTHWIGMYSGCSNGVPPMHSFQAEHRIQFRSHPMRFLGFPNYEKGPPRQEILK